MLIMTADIGEGHDLPARIIKADLEEEVPGVEVEIDNGLEAMGKLSAVVLRGGSKLIFRWMPWLFDVQYWLITKFAPDPLALPPPRLPLLRPRRPARGRRSYDPDVVISTYPGVTAMLGMLRENRRLAVPVQSAITDLAGLRYWAHPGRRPALRHPPGVDRGSREAGRARAASSGRGRRSRATS